MKADIVVGMNFGSEAKGKVVQHLTAGGDYDATVRVQSIQAGHTVYYKGKSYKMRTIPCSWTDPNQILVLGAGCFIEKELLLEEIRMVSEATGEDVRDRLYVDNRATYIIPEDFKAEEGLDQKMGSTAHGAGASLIRKMWRKTAPTRTRDDKWAMDHDIKLVDSIDFLNGFYKVLVEGCQGTMLALHSSPYYPHITARECTASGILAEAGLSPRCVDKIHGVFRPYPIRVGGPSGMTGAPELTWDELGTRRGSPIIPERTTVTNRERRIFEFSQSDFKRAMQINAPTDLYMTFADYFDVNDYGKTNFDGFQSLSSSLHDFLCGVETMHNTKVGWIGTGELPEHYITK